MLVVVETDLENQFSLSPRNVFMILLIWLRTYPAYPLHEWRSVTGRWQELPGVVGVIDGTSHEILAPAPHIQRRFYSGHRKYHCIHTQIIIDNKNYVHSGILGHMNDAQSFNSLSDISPKAGLPFPRETFILGDKIYPCRYPLITGFTAAQIRTQSPLEIERRLVFNENVKIHTVYIEHVVGQMKTFKVIGSLYRHSRRRMSEVVKLCAGLSQRQAEFF